MFEKYAFFDEFAPSKYCSNSTTSTRVREIRMLFCNFVDTHAKSTPKTLPIVVFHSVLRLHKKMQPLDKSTLMLSPGGRIFAHVFEKYAFLLIAQERSIEKSNKGRKRKTIKNQRFYANPQSGFQGVQVIYYFQKFASKKKNRLWVVSEVKKDI